MKIEFFVNANVYTHSNDGDLLRKFDSLAELIKSQGVSFMATLDDLKAADVAEDTKIDALIESHKTLKQLVADLQAQVAAGAIDQAALQQLIDAANASAAKIDTELGVTAPVVAAPSETPASDTTGPV